MGITTVNADRAYVKLAGAAERYNYQGQVYERGSVYGMPADRARVLARKQDEYGRNYFQTLTMQEVAELTGEGVAAPKPKPKPKPKERLTLIEDGENVTEKAAKAKGLADAAETVALDKEPLITDNSIEVIGGLRPSAIEDEDDEDVVEV